MKWLEEESYTHIIQEKPLILNGALDSDDQGLILSIYCRQSKMCKPVTSTNVFRCWRRNST